MFRFIEQDDNKDTNIIECNKLNNDIIFEKHNVFEDDLVKLNNNQYIIMIKNGKILDIKKEPNLYIIKESEETELSESLKDLIIRDSESQDLCVIFFNMNVITQNRLIVNKRIKITNWESETTKRKHINMEVIFDFQINNPVLLLSKMIGLRNHFTKQELIEKIREFIIHHIEIGINEALKEYKFNSLTEDFSKMENMINKNKQDEKLLEYGIEVSNFKINEFEVLKRKFIFFKNIY